MKMKEIGDLIKKAGDIELYRRINKLEGGVIGLSRDKRQAEEKVEGLERALRFKGDLKFKDPYYWAGGRALIPKTAPGWRTLWGLVFQRVRKLTVLHGSFFSLSGRFFTSLGTTSSDLLHFP
jgi:hypothetical protein